jgi:hypothetical protein
MGSGLLWLPMAMGVNRKRLAEIILMWNILHPVLGNRHFKLLTIEAYIVHKPPYGCLVGFQSFRYEILPTEMWYEYRNLPN